MMKYLTRGEAELSVFFIDIDFFKKYNDTYGHAEGDECLKTVAKTLAESLSREDDFVARYGGEEFVVVLPNTGESGAKAVANTLLENVRAKNIAHEKNEAASCVTISVGITTGVVKHTQSGNDYIKKADEALYKSKQNGRNMFTFESFDSV
jgi:diguanylate cyclase (GGDEF)-like protein